MPRKIALLIHSLSGGGAERLMSQLAERWSSAHDVHLVTWSTRETDRYPLPASVQRHSLDLQRPSANRLAAVLANIRRVRLLREQLQSIAPDFVLSFCDQMNIVALEAARPLGIPLWIAEHSDPSKQRLSRIWEAWRARSYPTCSGAIALTRPIAQIMQQWIAADKLRVIPPAIHPPAIKPAASHPAASHPARQVLSSAEGQDAASITHAGLPSESTRVSGGDPLKSLTFIYLGRLSREKGVDVLLMAWGIVSREFPDCRLILVGDGDQREALELQARRLENVEFRGWVDDPWAELAQAECFVLPSRYEGFPIALLEAMECGLACITTDCTSALDELESCPAGESVDSSLKLVPQPVNSRSAAGPVLLRIPIEDSRKMADAMLRLAADPSLRRQLGSAARGVAERYHWSRIGAMWDAILVAK